MADKQKQHSAGSMKKRQKSFIQRVWEKYIKRLNKVTDGKPQCCK